MARKKVFKKREWKPVVPKGEEHSCDQCGEDSIIECPTCGKLDGEKPTMLSNGVTILCGDCYKLTVVEFWEKYA